MKNLYLILFLVLLASCELNVEGKGDLSFENEDDQAQEPPQAPTSGEGDHTDGDLLDSPQEEPVVKVSFSDLQKKVLTKYRCTGCHSAFTSERQIMLYISGPDPEDSLLYQVMKDGSMPPRGKVVSTADLELVEHFIEQL